MSQEEILRKTQEFVKNELGEETTGHDWWHSYRVWKNAIHIGKNEDVDMFIVQLAALLHDVGDWKLAGGDVESGPVQIRNWLESLNVEEEVITHVVEIVETLAFKGGAESSKTVTNEAKVVQDADRLEALGAVGIARAFATGQQLGQMIHNPDISVVVDRTEEEYKKQYTGERENTTLNHFYEKLLLLKDQMNTETGKKIAEHRHKFIELFLDEFTKEWDGNA